jgi:CheY-like chemotaxis protein
MSAPVLLVEDDEDIREVLAMALSDLGYSAVSATDGVDALRQMIDGGLRPALVLLDMMMPRMDGEALVGAMRQHPELTETPVLLMSGHTKTHQIAESLRLTALVKPVDLDELREAVTRLAGPP